MIANSSRSQTGITLDAAGEVTEARSFGALFAYCHVARFRYTNGMIQMAKRTVLTMQEAADELGISRQRLHVLCTTRGIRVDKVNPRLSLIQRRELEKLKQKRDSEKTA